ncbi:MAG: sulfite exporter TauE/SafE family protein [Candidatus Sericytochromatia bacterium]
MEYAVLALIGLATGLLSGLFGLGGGFLLVPLLALSGWELTHAIGTSLFYVALIGAGGALQHLRQANLDVQFVAIFSITSVLAAQGGALLTALFPEWGLSLAFGLFIVVMALGMGRSVSPPENGAPRPVRPLPTMSLGVAVGALSGLFGIGGGLLFVPAQMKSFEVPLKRAVGNSMAAVFLTGVSGVLAHVWLGHVRFVPGLVLIAGGLVGVSLGIRWLPRIPVDRLKMAMVVFLLLMAGYMIARGASPLWS